MPLTVKPRIVGPQPISGGRSLDIDGGPLVADGTLERGVSELPEPVPAGSELGLSIMLLLLLTTGTELLRRRSVDRPYQNVRVADSSEQSLLRAIFHRLNRFSSVPPAR